MKRRTFLKLSCLSLPALSLNYCGSRQKPNIILILIDDLGWKDLGYMGSRYYETPHSDRLASEGMIFTDAYANAPNCAPSRACLLTGLYPPRHGIYTVGSSKRGKSEDRKLIPIENTTTLDPSFVTIGEVLQENGYKTASMGKWHMGEGDTTGPEGQGFDVNIGGTRGGHPPAGYFPPYKLPGLENAQEGEYLTDRLTDEALSFIEDNHDRPFFLYLPHYAVHTPIQSKEGMTEKYRQKTGSNGQNNPEYAGMIESTDEGIGKIAGKLKELGIDENTVIIFTSDNGGVKGITSAEPLRGGKGMLYEGGIRVPLFIRWPGKIEPGSRCETPVIGLDLFDTIADLAGLAPSLHAHTDGLSLEPVLSQSGSRSERALYWHFPAYLQAYRNTEGSRDPKFRTRPCGVIRKGHWKLIEYFEDGALELYNLDEDPGETTNLAETHPEKRDELFEMMKLWRKETNAPVPTALNPEYILISK